MAIGTSKPVDYGKLIARHFSTRLQVLSSGEAAQVLANAGLEWDQAEATVRARYGTILTSEIAWSYKQAVRAVFGDNAYEMTRVNFALSGCRCRDCSAVTAPRI